MKSPLLGNPPTCILDHGASTSRSSRIDLTRSCSSREIRALSFRPHSLRVSRRGLKNCRVVQLGSGIHYLQEDHPDVIGSQVKEWLVDLGAG
jgi:hypothetical protein